MSEHDMMGHEADTSSNEESGKSNGLFGIVKSRYFGLGVMVVVLLLGFLLARRLGFGGGLLPILGLFAFMMVGRSFMRGGHGSHGGQGSYGGHGGHGGCGGSSHQHQASKPAQTDGDSSGPHDKDKVDPQDSHRGHSGCH